MMAAKALVPLPPSDLIGALFMLMYDADPNVRDTAGKTAVSLPDRIAASAFRDEEVQPPGARLVSDAVRTERRLRRDADSQFEHARRGGRGHRAGV